MIITIYKYLVVFINLTAHHWLKLVLSTAPQVTPRNFKLTAVSPYCVSLSYDPVEFPNGPESGLVYQVICSHEIKHLIYYVK